MPLSKDKYKPWLIKHVGNSGYLEVINDPKALEQAIIAAAEASYLLNEQGLAPIFRKMTFQQIDSFMPRDYVWRDDNFGMGLSKVWGNISHSRNNLQAHAMIKNAATIEYIIANGYAKYLAEKNGTPYTTASTSTAVVTSTPAVVEEKETQADRLKRNGFFETNADKASTEDCDTKGMSALADDHPTAPSVEDDNLDKTPPAPTGPPSMACN